MLKVQTRLAAKVLKCGLHRVRLNPENTEEIKEAITKADIRSLVKKGLIYRAQVKNTSRFWARKIHSQKKSGRQRGVGSRRGKKTARHPSKRAWINKIRSQRKVLNALREKGAIDIKSYHELYMKAKGGYFRSVRHLDLYIKERGLIKNV